MIAQPLTSLTDDQLVLRFRAGDDAAFSEIHRRFRSALTAFARRMLQGSGHDADDVVQDAFIRAYRGLRVTDRPMALRPWLYMIVRNRALDELRAPQRADAYDDELGCAPCPRPTRRNASSSATRCARSSPRSRRLPERQRIALVMREFDGRTHAETARALHTTVPATKSLIVRARSNLARARVHAA